MSERAYRERLEADLARWQADGLLPPKSADAIRATLRPVPESLTIATVVGIVKVTPDANSSLLVYDTRI